MDDEYRRLARERHLQHLARQGARPAVHGGSPQAPAVAVALMPPSRPQNIPPNAAEPGAPVDVDADAALARRLQQEEEEAAAAAAYQYDEAGDDADDDADEPTLSRSDERDFQDARGTSSPSLLFSLFPSVCLSVCLSCCLSFFLPLPLSLL